ncbi:RC-LH1 core complex protein PufX [Jannaschia sp. S6380]|uniref:RC-LH1 core complex protein PufX n=1 Tax=Jannaschia sp. S6380 TaxID=2926408 RepID=UPI001FF538F6|nr:RC-LH1 core complex protein PufX [Jannaschia sp. S6380]MCK0167671.1 RC-LH1 core complex protein PufX [Jannaschia sp. S6380]
MSDNHDYLKTSTGGFRLRADVLALMLKGAAYAAILCFAILILGWILLGVSRLLPPESKEAWDPTPTSSVVLPGPVTQDVL